MSRLGRGLGLTCAALGLFALAWLGLQPGDTGPQVHPTPTTASVPPVAEPREDVGAPGASSVGANDAVAVGIVEEEEGVYPDERRAKRLEEGIHLLLGSVAPELDLSEVERSCADDGRHCTFTGPWPGDDFLSRWIEATAEGAISSDQLRGVVIERFEPIDLETGETMFEIAAVLKRPNRR